MSRSLPDAAGLLDSLLGLIIDLVADGLRFFPFMRAALSAELLFLRKQLARRTTLGGLHHEYWLETIAARGGHR